MPLFIRAALQWLIGPLAKAVLVPTPTVSEADEKKARAQDVPPPPATAPTDKGAPWMALARAEDGTCEDPGNKSNQKILAYFRDAGHPEIVDDETAWCAAFANAMLERAGYGGTKLLNARSFMTWGVPLDKPKPGCIVVFARGNDGWSGHVGFYVGEDHDSIFVLGGNQWNPKSRRSEIVNVEKFAKNSRALRLLGYRWPTTFQTSRTYKAGAAAAGGQALSFGSFVAGPKLASLGLLGTTLGSVGSELKGASDYLPVLGFMGCLVTVVSIIVIFWARRDDARNNGG